MEKHFHNNNLSYYILDKYQKALARFERGLQSKRFASYTERKKRQIWNRLCRYARQVGIIVKPSLVTACLAAGLSLVTPAAAQTFTEQTGAANPFNGINIGLYATPTFVDIDSDGDMDAFGGEYSGTIKYYQNTGTASAPVFTAQTGAANPFDGVDIGSNSAPTFVDIDGDGDKDAFIGGRDGTIKYYENIGTAAAPVFTEQTGAANPFDGVDVGDNATPTFVNIDGDGDIDAFIGERLGTIKYYENIGTAAVPMFTEQTGAANPFDGLSVVSHAAPTFLDIDNDGDMDAFIGREHRIIWYYKNTGIAVAPVFTRQTGATDPFDGVINGNMNIPFFVDIDNDGDMDSFIGRDGGTVKYYQNTPIVLPVELLHFSASNQGDTNTLYWETANEGNNKGFQIERAPQPPKGAFTTTTWEVLGFVNAKGKATIYDFTDVAPPSGAGGAYYRLRQIDNDGKEILSKVVSVSNKGNNKLKAYPNPVSDILTIETGANDVFQILNVLGQQVLTGKTPPSEAGGLDMSALPPGTYFLKIGTEKVKFIKQ